MLVTGKNLLRCVTGVLTLFLLVLQYQIWFGPSSFTALGALDDELQAQQRENQALADRNRQLEVEILDLKNGLEAVEERARAELGMIRTDEKFYLIVE